MKSSECLEFRGGERRKCIENKKRFVEEKEKEKEKEKADYLS